MDEPNYTSRHVAMAEKNGIPYKVFYTRVMVLGWSLEEAMSIPPKTRRTIVISDDILKIAKQNGIPYGKLWQRIYKYGWDAKKAAETSIREYTKHPADMVRLAAENDITYSTFVSRINQYGWTPEKAATEPVVRGWKRKN